MSIYPRSSCSPKLRFRRILGAEDIVYHIANNPASHAGALLNRRLEPVRNRRGETLEVNSIAVGHVGHGGGCVDVGAVSGHGVDGGKHLGRVSTLPKLSSSTCPYHFVHLLLDYLGRSVLGEDGNPDLDGSTPGIGIKVGNVGKVNGGAVLDCLEATASVEVADRSTGFGGRNGAFRLSDDGAEGTRIGQLVCGHAGGKLVSG